MERSIRIIHERFADVEASADAACSWSHGGDFKVMHVAWNRPEPTYAARCRIAEGYMLFLVRRPLAAHPAWVDGRSAPIGPLEAGQFLLFDLRSLRSALLPGDFDCIAAYISSEAVRRFQQEHGLKPHGLLHAPDGLVHEDDAIRHLIEALAPTLDDPGRLDRLFLDHVSLALLSRLTARHDPVVGPDIEVMARSRGGLAPWQERTAKEMLLARSDGVIALAELAAACQLSRSHFCRAFKASTGLSPLRWLEGQRLERVKRMLEATDSSLQQIAVACGFFDASHLGRVFLRDTGLRPGAWRRLRRG